MIVLKRNYTWSMMLKSVALLIASQSNLFLPCIKKLTHFGNNGLKIEYSFKAPHQISNVRGSQIFSARNFHSVEIYWRRKKKVAGSNASWGDQ